MSSPSPSYNVIDDFSPYIKYDKGWLDQSALYTTQSDRGLDGYYNRTYHTAHSDSIGFGIMFVGIRVDVFGTLKSNHGQYSVFLDTDPKTSKPIYKDEYSKDEKINSTLFSANVEMGTHRLYIRNEVTYTNIVDRTVLGLDSISFIGYPIDWTDPSSETDTPKSLKDVENGAIGLQTISTTSTLTTTSPFEAQKTLDLTSTSSTSPPPVAPLPPPLSSSSRTLLVTSHSTSSIPTSTRSGVSWETINGGSSNQRQQANGGPVIDPIVPVLESSGVVCLEIGMNLVLGVVLWHFIVRLWR